MADIIESRSIDFQGGLTGCRAIAGTIAVTGAFQAFVVNADCEVAEIIDDKGVDVTSAMGLSGLTIRQGMLISSAKEKYFTSIRLNSGSIIAYYP
jgi:hypothetical protein